MKSVHYDDLNTYVVVSWANVVYGQGHTAEAAMEAAEENTEQPWQELDEEGFIVRRKFDCFEPGFHYHVA